MRIVAPSTGQSDKGCSRSPVLSISIAPKPPTITSSKTCSVRERNESSGIGRIAIVSEDAYAQICIRQLFSASRPRLNSPAHSRDLVLDCVDRLPGHRRFSKTSQVGWRRLWVRIGPRTIGVQDGRQGHGSPLALRTSGQRHFCNPAHCAAQLLFNIHGFLYESVGQPAPRLSNV